MIRKIWNADSPNYDNQFDKASDNLWDVWREECGDVRNRKKFIERFGYKLFVDSGSWDGLIFRNKGHYMLFLLEWS
jgi:hypothetical protein